MTMPSSRSKIYPNPLILFTFLIYLDSITSYLALLNGLAEQHILINILIRITPLEVALFIIYPIIALSIILLARKTLIYIALKGNLNPIYADYLLTPVITFIYIYVSTVNIYNIIKSLSP